MNDTYNIKKDWSAQSVDIFGKNFTDRAEFLVRIQLEANASLVFGAPKEITISYSFPINTPIFSVELQWFEKTPTRLPEAMWLKMNPIVGDPRYWSLDVMGLPVNPLEVVVNGSRHLHAIWDGISYNNPNTQTKFTVSSLDAFLVAPGDTDHLLYFDGESQPNIANGMHWNIYNNLWGTAFNQWYSDDAKFRFTILPLR